MHDRVAELAGLRAELAMYEKSPAAGQADRTGEVRAQIDRVRGELEEQAAGLEKRAEELLAAGQDGAAGEVRVQARALREVLDADGPAQESPKRGGKRNTAAAKAPETR
ncbi:MAG TPA: hypothetical protein VN088_17105 [Nocardioides sp.]|nr:hypothetical protein [Nocardioides sp.]